MSQFITHKVVLDRLSYIEFQRKGGTGKERRKLLKIIETTCILFFNAMWLKSKEAIKKWSRKK